MSILDLLLAYKRVKRNQGEVREMSDQAGAAQAGDIEDTGDSEKIYSGGTKQMKEEIYHGGFLRFFILTDFAEPLVYILRFDNGTAGA